MTKKIKTDEFIALYKFHREFSRDEAQSLLDDLVRDNFIMIEKPMLTKEILKENGVAGKTVLKHKHNSNTFLYIGFNRADKLVTDDARGKYSAHWLDGEIKLLEIVEESND